MRASPRGRFVYDSLTSTADRSQRPLKAWLRQRHVPFKSFWILNAVRVTAGSSVLHALAARPDVEKILPDVDFRVPKVTPGQGVATPGTVEWGLTNINAPQVWTNFNDRGDGIVVANIDTGVQYNHPPLSMQYRGRQADGTFNHNYNWNDPSGICGARRRPCDNNNTAPTRWARWWATTALRAPTGSASRRTRSGSQPRGANRTPARPRRCWRPASGCWRPPTRTARTRGPTMRPNIVNNSWGGGGGEHLLPGRSCRSWVAAGIFPTFSNGNSGPGCSTWARRATIRRATASAPTTSTT